MGLIPKVKCSRCDRSYSGLKNKCPACGASRGRGGKRVADGGDAMARMAIRLLLLLAVVITVISVVVLDLSDDPDALADSQTETSETQENGGEEGGEFTLPPLLPPEPEPEPPSVEATSIDISWAFRTGNINEMTIGIGDELDVWSEVFPTDADIDVEWSTSDPTVVNYTVSTEDFQRIAIVGRSRGDATITATAGGLSTELIVRVR